MCWVGFVCRRGLWVGCAVPATGAYARKRFIYIYRQGSVPQRSKAGYTSTFGSLPRHRSLSLVPLCRGSTWQYNTRHGLPGRMWSFFWHSPYRCLAGYGTPQQDISTAVRAQNSSVTPPATQPCHVTDIQRHKEPPRHGLARVDLCALWLWLNERTRLSARLSTTARLSPCCVVKPSPTRSRDVNDCPAFFALYCPHPII